jgi:cytochrome P450
MSVKLGAFIFDYNRPPEETQVTTFHTDSKTAREPYRNSPRVEEDAAGVWHIHGYAEAKDLLKEDLLQDGFNADDVNRSGMDPVLYQHGEAHRKQRAAIAKYFSPTTVSQKHNVMMERVADEIIADLVKAKRADLRQFTTRMATVVAAAVVGLKPTSGLVKRLDAMLHTDDSAAKHPLLRIFEPIRRNLTRISFLFLDVRPAIRQRRRNPEDDVVSYMLSKGKSDLAIFVECVVYGAAGMATTQEFICITLMHAMENPEIREALASEDIDVRYEALHEILRLEPVIGKIKRKTLEPVSVTSKGETHTIPAGAKIEFHVYDVNADAESVEEEPERIHAHRDLEKGTYRSLIGFGSGPHRCAGEYLAISETDIFIRKLMALKGLRVIKPPKISYNATVEGYEVSDYIIEVD